jgi:UDP-N-acetylglucosamine 4-epimerase
MTAYASARERLREQPRRWLVTGVAGFIGSNLLETLIRLDQEVVGLDDFSTGHRRNIEDALEAAGDGSSRFELVEGDVADPETCRETCRDVDVVLHQAALGSVPRSLKDPAATHRSNVDGTVALLDAAREAGVPRVVYASSSSVYGDHPDLPKVEENTGQPLSPYAASKAAAELYGRTYHLCYEVETVGLRYFNVFGRRQDPHGPYAAVIPRWIGMLLSGQRCPIFGDGETSRDFCHVENVVQANLLAATAPSEATGEVYNVAFGERTTLNELFAMIRDALARQRPGLADSEPVYEDFRPGDVRHSLADISKARERLGYRPTHSVREGLESALEWYTEDLVEPAGG